MNRGMSSIWYGTETDIEDLKQAQVKLRQDEQELRRMTDAIPQAIVVQRPDGTPIYANQVTLEYTGLTLEDVQADGFRERIFRPHDQEQVREERQKALAIGEPFEIEQRTRRNDGQYRWFLIRYNPLRDDNGHVIRWYATGTDIEDRKQAEEKMRNENLALREVIADSSMFEEIVGSSESLRRVLSQVAKVARTDSTVLILGEIGTGATWRSPVQHHTLPRRDRSRPYVVAEPDRVLSRGQGDRLVDLFRRKLRARSVEHGVVIRAGHFHCQGS
jgi:formate hydrogenlyase transcriptional activator